MSELSAGSVAIIEAATGWRKDRVQIFELPEGKVIVKGHRPLRGPWMHRILNVIAKLLRVPMAQAVPVHGGARSQEVELRRLAALQAAGAPVPKVLHVAPDYFVMNYLGSTHLAGQLSGHGFAAYELWREAARQIVQVHAQGQYLSQCFGRNVIVDQSQTVAVFAGLIDFEDDPAAVMSVQDAQVRDWLIFLQSTIYPLSAPDDVLHEALKAIFMQERAEIRFAFFEQARKLAWLRYLPSQRKPWGKDTVSVQAASKAMHRLVKSSV
jgi:tRNA A-37 threonylcarbamoyl transferase component Bud32